jgi:FkbM family methyltransferase
MFDRKFKCSESIRPHLEKIFAGEYEVPLNDGPYGIIDCGANVGAFAMWASKRWPGSLIYAYEPHPETFKLLVENTEYLSDRILRYEKGLGLAGWRPLYNGMYNEGEATLYPNAVSNGTGQHVEIISPLELPKADILKIDCEGAELEILAPLLSDGRKFKAIMIEFHNEGHRREIDFLLRDYHLIRCDISPYTHNIGTVAYMHKECIK